MDENLNKTVVDGADDATDNAAIGSADNPADGGKTFTQEQLNAIIGERLNKERAKLEAELAGRERELANKEFTLKAKDLLKTRDFPFEVLGALNAPDEETLTKSIETIFSYFEKRANPINLGHPSMGNWARMPLEPLDRFKDKEADQVRAAMGLK